MEEDLVKKDWIERALNTFKFHRSKLKSEERWTADKTAFALHRSGGSICEDLKIARWMRTHPKDIESFKYMKDALLWIKKKEKEVEIGDD